MVCKTLKWGGQKPPHNYLRREQMFKRFKEMFSIYAVNIEVYRCDSCHRVITNFSIEKGILCPCGQNQFRPTNPSLWEKIMILARYIIKGY